MTKNSRRLGNQALNEIREKLRELMNEYSDNMSTGGCSDFAEYRHQVGVIHGLALAERELIEMDQRLTEE